MGLRLLSRLFGGFIVWTLAAIPYLNLQLLAPASSATAVFSVVFALALIGGVIRLRSPLSSGLERLGAMAARVSPCVWLWLLIGIAIVLRLLWWFAFKAPLRSDGATYFGLATQLVEQGIYGGDAAGRAYWPPGLPFFFTPFISLFGPHPEIVVLGNLILSSFAIVLTYQLAKRIAGETAAKMASLIIALWPSQVMNAGIASKEQLLLTLLTGVFGLLVRSLTDDDARFSKRYVFGAGLLLGATALTQPSFILFPGVLVLTDWLRSANARQGLARLALIVAGMALIVSPWTLRNYAVFGERVLISTNGGDVFYRANNPLATGGYTDRGEVDLSQWGELEKNRMGHQLAREWIFNNFGAFLRLAAQKQILFLGDDGGGAYETLKRALGIEGATYILFKGVANGYWLLLWMLILLGWLTRCSVYQTPTVALLVLAVFYLLAIDSVFESGGRHHIPIAGALAVLAALPFARVTPATPAD